jgi:putative hydrolase of the HAD superfamily
MTQYSSMDNRWPVHTVVFDLDDTLYDEKNFVFSGFAAVETWLREVHRVDEFATHARRLFDSGLRGQIFDESLKYLGLGSSPQLVAEMVEVYRRHEPRLELLPEARDALVWARSEGLRLAVVTDGYAMVQRRKITALGLATQIDCCVVSDELGGRAFWKPNKAPFLRVMGDMNGEPTGFVYVADNPRKDFIAPRALRWRTLRVRREGTEHGRYEATVNESAEKDITSLAALPSILRASQVPRAP